MRNGSENSTNNMFNYYKRNLELGMREKSLQLERENFEREKQNMRKEIELKFEFDKKGLENEWHCKLGQAIDERHEKAREEINGMITKVIDLISKLKPGENKVEILK